MTGSINRSTLDSTGIISSPVAGTIALPSAAATQQRPATSASFRETAVFGQTRFLETMGTFVRGEQGETVVITASANAELLDVAGRAKRRKVWVVGDAAIESDAPIERVGTQWPL